MVFDTAIDLWLFYGVIAVVLAGLAHGLYLLKKNKRAAVIRLAGSSLVVGLLLVFAWPIRYELDEDSLNVHWGVLTTQVPYKDISKVQKGTPWLAAPAWSLDRLEVQYGDSSVTISPETPDKFKAALAERAGLTEDGGDLVR